MSTAAQAPPRVADIAVVPGEQRRAMLALARVEAVRLLRHPAVILGVLLFMVPWAVGKLIGGDRYPILQDADSAPQFVAMLLLGGGALVGASFAALRAQRHHTAPLYEVLVLPDPWRTGAFLLSVVPLAVVAAALAGVRIGFLAALPGAAGRPNPWELALYPALVLLLGAAGVLLARTIRSHILPVLMLPALAVASFASILPSVPGARHVRWLLPVAMEPEPPRLPVDLLTRPAGRHLAYVVGLIVLAAAAALLVSGARGRRLTAVAVAGLSVAALAGTAQLIPPDKAARAAFTAAVERPAERQVCRRVDQITYCAFADFTPWIDAWDEVVRGVLRWVPEDVAREPFTVRQRVVERDSFASSSVGNPSAQADVWRRGDAAAGTPRTVAVGTAWGDGRSEIAFAGMVAYEMVTHAGTGAAGVLCGARAVVMAWLAAQSMPGAVDDLRAIDQSSGGAVGFDDPVSGLLGASVPDREMAVAWALLRRPAEQVAPLIVSSWARLTATDAPTERVGELFGVPVPAELPEGERMVCSA
ncbi:hypothetical protein ACTMTJ_07955 [Phytohabitans sp. LJ34]|uniref:hypothetical protein n=1 Tax=Phytohabitans sp. LJ34 TaxID=3452217 RepID=UPI003F89F815